jgi:hypothetical protein
MQSWRSYLKRLKLGLGVKRWLLLLVLGIGLLSLGMAMALLALYPLPQFFYFLTLQFLPRGLRASVVITVGISAIIYGHWGLYHAILEPLQWALHSPSRRPSMTTVAGDVGRRSL